MENTHAGTFFEKYGTAIALLVGLIIIAGAIAFGHGSATQQAGIGAPVKVNIKDVKTDGNPFIGSPTAPVTIALWFDYQCPFCKRFETDTLSKVYQDYVTTGKVKIVYKDFQFLGDDSDTDALFARAVWATYPDKFQDWFVAMTAAQDAENGGFGDLESVVALTKGIDGMDTDHILKVMNDRKDEFTKAIAADRAEGDKLGVQGTPAAIIGTTLIGGAQPYVATGAANETPVKPLIEAELAK